MENECTMWHRCCYQKLLENMEGAGEFTETSLWPQTVSVTSDCISDSSTSMSFKLLVFRNHLLRFSCLAMSKHGQTLGIQSEHVLHQSKAKKLNKCNSYFIQRIDWPITYSKLYLWDNLDRERERFKYVGL